MVVQHVATGGRRQRCDPQARLEPLLLDPADEALHLGLAARKLPGVEIPVADGRLPTVIDDGPGKPELLHLRQRVLDQLYGAVPLIAPGTPDRLVGFLRWLRRSQPPFPHESSIGVERREVVTAMRGHESLERLERLTRWYEMFAFRMDLETGRTLSLLDRQ